jgi:hypothetical protein
VLLLTSYAFYSRQEIHESIKYKYIVVGEGGKNRWEDSIADRTLEVERRAGGVLAQGVCDVTYVTRPKP